MATSAVRDTNRGVGVHEVEEELLVGDEVEAVDLSGCLTELGNKLGNRRRSGSALLGERRAGKGKERSEGSNREHCVVTKKKGLVEEEKKNRIKEEKRKTQTPELRGNRK